MAARISAAYGLTGLSGPSGRFIHRRASCRSYATRLMRMAPHPRHARTFTQASDFAWTAAGNTIQLARCTWVHSPILWWDVPIGNWGAIHRLAQDQALSGPSPVRMWHRTCYAGPDCNVSPDRRDPRAHRVARQQRIRRRDKRRSTRRNAYPAGSGSRRAPWSHQGACETFPTPRTSDRKGIAARKRTGKPSPNDAAPRVPHMRGAGRYMI